MDINELTYQINGAIFEINRELGAGFLTFPLPTSAEENVEIGPCGSVAKSKGEGFEAVLC